MQEKLWEAVRDGTFDLVASDHSPSTQNLKNGTFETAWGGISSLQFSLSSMWTELSARNFTIMDLTRLLSQGPSKLCNYHDRKGALKIGMDADFVVWNPDEKIKVH